MRRSTVSMLLLALSACGEPHSSTLQTPQVQTEGVQSGGRGAWKFVHTHQIGPADRAEVRRREQESEQKRKEDAWLARLEREAEFQRRKLDALLRDQQVVSLQEYKKMKTGMSYSDVYDILDGPGQERSSSNIGGIVTISYQWSNEDGSNVLAIFQNDRLVQKAQAGLQ